MTAPRPIALWLLAMSALVFCMVVIGGITRLTESGLSMVEWRALMDTLPPLTEEAWARAFALYRETPEFRLKNFWMGLQDFKTIYLWEWVHRLWGRLLGLAFVLPLLWFVIRRQVPPGLLWRLLLLLALGGLQGAIGWWMVRSGLVDRPDVSQYRLAVHLLMAFVLHGLLLWTALDLLRGRAAFAGGAAHLALFILVVVGSGALVAGLDAGRIYNEYPLMGGGLLPPDYGHLSPWWVNAFENAAAVQFHHRWLAVVAVAGCLAFGLGRGHGGLAAMAVVQMGLGVATLLAGVPVWLGALHQAGAFLLFTLALVAAHTESLRKGGLYAGRGTFDPDPEGR